MEPWPTWLNIWWGICSIAGALGGVFWSRWYRNQNNFGFPKVLAVVSYAIYLVVGTSFLGFGLSFVLNPLVGFPHEMEDLPTMFGAACAVMLIAMFWPLDFTATQRFPTKGTIFWSMLLDILLAFIVTWLLNVVLSWLHVQPGLTWWMMLFLTAEIIFLDVITWVRAPRRAANAS